MRSCCGLAMGLGMRVLETLSSHCTRPRFSEWPPPLNTDACSKAALVVGEVRLGSQSYAVSKAAVLVVSISGSPVWGKNPLGSAKCAIKSYVVFVMARGQMLHVKHFGEALLWTSLPLRRTWELILICHGLGDFARL